MNGVDVDVDKKMMMMVMRDAVDCSLLHEYYLRHVMVNH